MPGWCHFPLRDEIGVAMTVQFFFHVSLYYIYTHTVVLYIMVEPDERVCAASKYKQIFKDATLNTNFSCIFWASSMSEPKKSP